MLLLVFGSADAQRIDLNNFLPDSIFGTASVSLTIADMVTGEVLYSIDPSKTVVPASVQKLVTSSTALEFLGPSIHSKQ